MKGLTQWWIILFLAYFSLLILITKTQFLMSCTWFFLKMHKPVIWENIRLFQVQTENCSPSQTSTFQHQQLFAKMLFLSSLFLSQLVLLPPVLHQTDLFQDHYTITSRPWYLENSLRHSYSSPGPGQDGTAAHHTSEHGCCWAHEFYDPLCLFPRKSAEFMLLVPFKLVWCRFIPSVLRPTMSACLDFQRRWWKASLMLFLAPLHKKCLSLLIK